ncbi:MAG: MFS transporter, partial [Planctomycetota bacterium]
MTRFLIYLFPAVADVILAATMFVCSNRIADAGQSRTEVAMVFAAWAAVYIVSNQILARLVTSRNAAAMMIVANLLFVVTAGTFVLIENVLAIYATMGVLAVATALFFLPFQVFMKAVEPDQHQGVVRSAAIYTFSWSLGFACGPFIAGFIY